ncbi:MAG: carbohydrate kinase family protein [Armatimonadota bacterium]
MPDVACLGILVADVVAKPVDEYPERGKLVLCDQIELHSGGCAANTAIGLARLGASVAVLGKVGNDGFGDFVVDSLTRERCDCSGIVRDPDANTSATCVLVHSDGERSFVHNIGANATIKPEDVNMDIIRAAKILHYAGHNLMPGFDGAPAASVLKAAKDAGVTTCLDTAWDATGQWMSLIEPCLPHVDLCLPSVEEARMITGKETPRSVAQVLLDHGVKTVGLKMGTQGCYVCTADEDFTLPIYPVVPIDATGAGDAFVAGFLRALLEGWQLDWVARLANAVGALCVTGVGTTQGIRGWDDTLQFMESHGDPPPTSPSTPQAHTNPSIS